MSQQELCFLAIAEQAKLIRTKQVSPVEVVTSALSQIERLDPRVNAYITVTTDAALAEARQAEQEVARGGYRGPLHGIPVGLKDTVWTKGVRTTAGSKILAGFVPNQDATVVTRLKAAGAVILGKMGMYEFAYSVTSTNPLYPEARNPWDLSRMTGGSSSGSAAAIAASMGSAAIGSDTGGSVRLPAAFCGVVGLKPSYGRVSVHGTIPTAPSLDTLGIICKTAQDGALVLAAIAGRDPRDTTSSPEPVPDYTAEISRGISGAKLGLIRELVSVPMDPEVAAGFQAALKVLAHLGAAVEEVSIPEIDLMSGYAAITSSEAAAYHEEYLRSRSEEYTPEVRERLRRGLVVPAVEYVKAQRARTLLAEAFRTVFERYDALLCPSVPITAPRLGQETIWFDGKEESIHAVLPRLTRLFSFAGVPAITVPCGFDSHGLPIGLQIAAAPFAEGTVLQVAHAYQERTQWHRGVPPVAMP